MPFWKHPELSDHPEGELTVPENAGEPERAAIAAFNAGDFSRCRRLVRDLRGGADTDPGASAAVAADLERRLRMDPVLLGIAAASVLVLVFLSIWAVMSSH